MLSSETMGLFCLGVVWLNALLIVAHVWRTGGALARERASVGEVWRAVVVDTGQAPALVTVCVSQVGRAITEDGPRRILFTEASRRSCVHAARIEIGGEKVEVVASDHASVWCLDGAARHEEDFDRAYGEANTSRGYKAEVEVALGAKGAVVWIGGTREGGTLQASFVSDRDPRAVVTSARARVIGFVALAIVSLVGISALALTRPWFSGLSTVGGMLAIAYFLGVQPMANALRESIASPPTRPMGGIWQGA